MKHARRVVQVLSASAVVATLVTVVGAGVKF
jgi:hypothetical protein